jgi:hypothetical protein
LISDHHRLGNRVSHGLGNHVSDDSHLAEIHLIADVCHNLPAAASVHSADGYDPFVYMWQTATTDQKRWLSQQLKHLGADDSYLVESPPWPPPAVPPAQRPRLAGRGWRIPRDPDAFIAVDTAKLQELVREAYALEPPGRKSPDWTLAHLHPDGRHILRPSRHGEPLFFPPGPDDLRQYRGLLHMADGATVVGHLRRARVQLRGAASEPERGPAVPAGRGPIGQPRARRLSVAA